MSVVQAVSTRATRVNVSWTDVTSGEEGFELERSPNGVTSWTLLDTLGPNVTSYSDLTVSPNTTYYYRVRSFVSVIFSDWSNVAEVLTLNPGRPPIKYRMYLHKPEVVFRARVNIVDTLEFPLDYIPYDTVTLGSYTDIKPGMTVVVGSTAGSYNHGMQRVRGNPTTISIFVGRSSRGKLPGELSPSNDDYIEVWDDRRLWALIPYIDPDGNIFKDSNLSVGSHTTEDRPVANGGTGVAGTADAITELLAFSFTGENSIAVATGATITDFLWNVKDGTLTSGTTASMEITANFPPGFRYVELTVTDSNDHTHTTYIPVFVDAPDHSLSVSGFDLEDYRITDKGQSISVRMLQDIPLVEYPDGTLAMIWENEPPGTDHRDHMTIVGWLDEEQVEIRATKRGLKKDTTISILDAAGRADQLPGFPISLTRDSIRDEELVPDITWNYHVDPNLKLYIIYLLKYHSNILELVEFIFPDPGDEYPFVMLGSNGATLWDQVNRRAEAFIPAKSLTFDRQGILRVVADPMMCDEEDRTDVVIATIDESDWAEIRFTRRRSPKYHWLRGKAVLAGTSQPIQTYFAVAPGATPGQGPGETTLDEKLANNAEDVRKATGHKYARDNSEFTDVTIKLVQNDSAAGSFVPWRNIEPAFKEWITITMSADSAAQRGIEWTSHRALPKEVNIQNERSKFGLKRTITIKAELETVGFEAEEEVRDPVSAPNEPTEPGVIPDPIPPPDYGLIVGHDLLVLFGANGHLYRTSNFQDSPPTYDDHNLGISEECMSMVIDPFSPGYDSAVAGGTIDGWIATANAIYRIDNIFGTPVKTAVKTFSVNADFRRIQASFGTYFVAGKNPWLVCSSYYTDEDRVGTWVCFSKDAGQTWSLEIAVSNEEADYPFPLPIGVYTSPRTPGLAYTVAYISLEDLPNESLRPFWGQVPEGGSWFTNNWSSVSGGVQSIDDFSVNSHFFMFHPPNNCKRLEVEGSFYLSVDDDPSHPNPGSARIDYVASASFTVTTDIGGGTGEEVAEEAQTVQGSFSLTIVKNSDATDWPVSKEEALSTPPTTQQSPYIRLRAISVSENCLAQANLSARFVEMEMEDGTIIDLTRSEYNPFVTTNWGQEWDLNETLFVPVRSFAGSIHVPWEDNSDEDIIYHGAVHNKFIREIRLKKVELGVTSDISPLGEGGIRYGVDHGLFSIRAFDGNRQYVILGGVGNDISINPDDDLTGVWISSTAGDSWLEIIAPTNLDSPFSVAFSGDTEQTFYVWGPSEYMGLSTDFGDTILDKSGNLGALGAGPTIGIAGGPTS